MTSYHRFTYRPTAHDYQPEIVCSTLGQIEYSERVNLWNLLPNADQILNTQSIILDYTMEWCALTHSLIFTDNVNVNNTHTMSIRVPLRWKCTRCWSEVFVCILSVKPFCHFTALFTAYRCLRCDRNDRRGTTIIIMMYAFDCALFLLFHVSQALTILPLHCECEENSIRNHRQINLIAIYNYLFSNKYLSVVI